MNVSGVSKVMNEAKPSREMITLVLLDAKLIKLSDQCRKISAVASPARFYGVPEGGTFVVMRLEKNSRIIVPPAFPAIPMAALVNTSPMPRSAWG